MHTSPNATPHGPRRSLVRLGERWLVPFHESLLGDLEEDFNTDRERHGGVTANLIFSARLIYLAVYLRLRYTRRSNAMLKVNLLVALRNLRKSVGYSSINIVGLAASMAVCLLLITLLREQWSFDRFHEHANRIWRVTSEVEESYGRFTMATSPGPMGPAMAAGAPGVEAVTRLMRMGGNATHGDVTLPLSGLYVEPSFFDLFDFPLVRGNPETALAAPYAIVLTQTAAARYFGGADPMGEILQRGDLGDFTVTGIVADPPGNTHLAFEALASLETLVARSGTDDPYNLEDWTVASTLYTYVLLTPDARPGEVAAFAQVLVDTHAGASERPHPAMDLQALTGINLGPDLSNQLGPVMPRDATYVLVFFAALLLLVAIFNYVNLTIARAMRRSREIGVRKVMGARRGQIVAQFALEAVVVAGFSLAAAAVMLVWLLPAFNDLTGFRDALDLGRISVDPFGDGMIYVLYVGFAVAVGIVAGLIPALRLSNLAPSPVLRGLSGGGVAREGIVRRSLIVFQFVLAITGVVTATLIHRQMSMVLAADYGFGEDGLMAVELQGVPYDRVAAEFGRAPGVLGVAAASTLPSGGSKYWTSIRGDQGQEDLLIQFFDVDASFPGLLRIGRVAGRDLATATPSDDPEPVWITVAGARALGYDSPERAVGATIEVSPTWEAHQATVVGVMDDFFARGYERGYSPAMLRLRPDGYQLVVVRFAPGQVQPTLKTLRAAFDRVAPGIPFEYSFYDEEIASQYAFIRDLVRFLGLLTALVILIACLGLLGAVSHSAQRRVREVGIRKVLGAEVRGTVAMLSRDYIRLIALAVLIATPLTWLAGSTLLQKFPNHVEMNVWILLAGTVPIVVLALITVGTQTLRAALTNPVDTLRQE